MKYSSKKFLAVLLAVITALSVFSGFSVFAADAEYQYNVDDATLVQRYCAFLESFDEELTELYDVNFDGFVSIGDASVIQMHAAGFLDINSEEYRGQFQTEPFTVEETTEDPSNAEITEEPTTADVTEESTAGEETTEPATAESTAEPATREADEAPAATYMSFDLSVLYMGINEAYVLCPDTDAQEYTLTSSNESVAEINSECVVLPRSLGTTIITCTAPNGIYARCLVYVGMEAEALIMNTPAVTLGLGESFDLNSFTVGNGYFAANRVFYSSNESVAAVDPETGVFTAVGLGKATVTCTLINGVKADCEITVLELSETVTLNVTNVTAGVGELLGFSARPESGKATVSRKFYSEDESIVQIGLNDGLMTGQAVGKTRIYCELPNGFRAYADVNILPAPQSVKLNATACKIKVGDVIQLKEFYNEGSYNTPYTLEWTSSNRAVNIESRSGYLVTLKAKALGTSVITAKTYNGLTVKCTVTVSGSNVKCVDISSWQGGTVDFNKLKASGISHVIIRAGFKTTADSQFVNNYNKAKAAGMKIGSYWYMCANNYSESVKEAEACIRVLGNRKLDLPVYYDIEEPGSLNSNTQAALTNMAVAFCEALKNKGYKVGTYASGSVYAKNYKLNTDLLRQKGYSIWDAEWASKNTVTCDIWQYSDTGRVSGIDGNVDMDLIYNLYLED